MQINDLTSKIWLIEPRDPDDPDWLAGQFAADQDHRHVPHIIVHALTKEDALWVTANRFAKGLPKYSGGVVDALHFDLFRPANGRVSCRDIGPSGSHEDVVFPLVAPTSGEKPKACEPVFRFPKRQVSAYEVPLEVPTIYWPGKSGDEYRYWIYGIDKGFKNRAANYIFARETSPGRHRPIYVGETDDLSTQALDHHPAHDLIVENDATHIHVHSAILDHEGRLMEREDLVGRWRPPCNATELSDQR